MLKALYSKVEVVISQINAAKKCENMPADVKGMLESIHVGMGRILEDTMTCMCTYDSDNQATERQITKYRNRIKVLEEQLKALKSK